MDKGLGIWCFFDDLLDNSDFVKIVEDFLSRPDEVDDELLAWESIKSQAQSCVQQYVNFCRKQHRSEIHSLQMLLRHVNKRIYQGEVLEVDQCHLQVRIAQCENTIWDKKQSPEKWALKEGSMSPDFLHLEDELHGSIDITKLRSSGGDIVSGDDVLTVMRSFYTDLYGAQDQVSKSEIDTFLEKIQIPELVSEIEEGTSQNKKFTKLLKS